MRVLTWKGLADPSRGTERTLGPRDHGPQAVGTALSRAVTWSTTWSTPPERPRGRPCAGAAAARLASRHVDRPDGSVQRRRPRDRHHGDGPRAADSAGHHLGGSAPGAAGA